ALGKIAGILHRHAIDGGDDVACLDAGLLRRAAGLRFGNERAFRLLEAEAVGDVLRHRLDLHADPAARDRAMVLELTDDAGHRFRRDRKRDDDRTTGRREDRRINADHVSFGVEGRTAGVAFVDRGVDLNEVVISTGADIASPGRDNTGGDGTAEAERITDRQYPVANARGFVGELHVGEWPALDLDQCEIGARVGADNFGIVSLAVVRGDLDGVGLFDNVVVRDRVSVGRNDEARALAGDHATRTAATTRHPFWTVRHTEAAEEFTQARRNLVEVLIAEAIGLRAAVHFDADGDHRRLHFLHDVGEADRSIELTRLLGQVLCDRRWIASRQIETGGNDQRGNTEAGDGSAKEREAAGGKSAPGLRLCGGNDARG